MVSNLPVRCRECDEDCTSVYDHADGCSVARRIARRQIATLEDCLGTAWETEETDAELSRLREVAGE